MAEEWHSYQKLADALGVQLQAVYKRRKRGGWQQRVDNQTGEKQVLVDIDTLLGRRKSVPAHDMSDTGTGQNNVPVRSHSQETLEAAVQIAELTAKLEASELRVGDLQERLGKTEAQMQEAMDLLKTLIERGEAPAPQQRGFWAWLTGGPG